ncbi:class I SAM-dependent methyltransferase [Actinomadura sp. NPDC047616]|uniref:class I SAM-dependent methyltransferase n=1 Tax=Actinomadura sp. NPDC047616 TaxID=3155914 RepID=UPI0033CC3B1F
MSSIDVDLQRTYEIFYRIPRAGQVRLSDGGGPFGFDIHLALLVHELVEMYGCDAICETGSFLGDTTAYLARRYPHLPVYSCDIDQRHVTVVRRRLGDQPNARVCCCDSPELVADVMARHQRPLFFLDAHWGDPWPLPRELTKIRSGAAVAIIHDFDVGHPRFAFDAYNGVTCGVDVLATLPDPPQEYFTPDPGARWPLPCLQVGRRAGFAVVTSGLNTAPLRSHPRLLARAVPQRTVTP